MSNLRLLSDTDLVDGVTTFSATDVFNADFDIYKITINNLSHNSGSPAQISYRFINSSGSVVTASNYDSCSFRQFSDASFSDQSGNDENDTRLMGYADFDTEASGFVIYIFQPFLSSSYTYIISQSANAVSGAFTGFRSIAVLKQTSAITGFQIIASSNTLDSGNMKVYGLRVDS